MARRSHRWHPVPGDLPDDMARRAAEHPNGDGLSGAGVVDDPAELEARFAAELAAARAARRARSGRRTR